MPYPTVRSVVAAALLGGAAMVAGAQTVTPPPLPPGSNLVRVEPGMSEPERKRYVRAHHHKFHHKKDYTRDDSIHGHESEAVVRTGAPQPLGAGPAPAGRAAGTVPHGHGTGPAREKTDRGASGYFYGNDKTKK